MSIRFKRIHDPVAADDGRRVLVDRLWPRGIARADAALDDWYRAVAPSTELRRWFGHDRDRWDEFRTRYRDELARCEDEALPRLRRMAADGRLTLLYAARDTICNHAVVLGEWLDALE